MKIYTRSGDRGKTGLLGGRRISKASPRVAAYGDVDELNALLGLAVARITQGLWALGESETGDVPGVSPGESQLAALQGEIQSVQRTLFSLGAELATAPDADGSGLTPIGAAEIEALEKAIDRTSAWLEPLHNFVLPGGSEAGATLHLARTVCRRAERSAVALMDLEQLSPEIVRFLNRLSDLLFVWARAANTASGTPEPLWSGDEGGSA